MCFDAYIIYVRIHEHVSRTYGFCVCRGSVSIGILCTRCVHIIICIILCTQSRNQWYVIVCHDADTTNNTTRPAYFDRVLRIIQTKILQVFAPWLYEAAVHRIYAASVGGGSSSAYLPRTRTVIILCVIQMNDTQYNIILYGRRGMRENENLFDVYYI